MTTPAAAIDEALSKFRARLTLKEQAEFQSTTLKDVRNTIVRIQHDQDNTKSMRDMARIQSFLEAMEQLSEVIEVFLNVSNFVAFVWGPIKFLLQVGSVPYSQRTDQSMVFDRIRMRLM
jgi:ABC-type sugar transport system ATPase subunit